MQQVLDALEANPKLKAETAVFVTWDEAGGYWDSGFIQPIDFFGDGPRIPAAGSLAVLHRRQGQSRLRRSRVAAEVHRAQLASHAR